MRSKRDSEWPTQTYEDRAILLHRLGRILLQLLYRMALGENENIPLVCINHDVSIIPTNEDDEIVEPSDQLLSWNMSTATAVDVLISQRADDKIAKFNSFRIAKTAVNADAKVIMSFTANATRQKITGYIRCDTADVPVGATPIAVYNTAGTVFGEIILQMHNRTYDVNGQRNTRIKYNVAEDGKVTAFFLALRLLSLL